MFQPVRKKEIINRLNRDHAVSVASLCETLYASPSTIRRDLIELEERGLVRRVYGGAVRVSNKNNEFNRTIEDDPMIEEKTACCKQALSHIHSDMVIFIDSSTTCYYICQFLDDFHSLTVITNSILIPVALKEKHNITTISTGGSLKKNSYSLINHISADAFSMFQPDLCFFSCKAFDQMGAYQADIQQTQMKLVMMENSNKNILLADSTKCNQSAYIKLCPLEKFDGIITTAPKDQVKNYPDPVLDRFEFVTADSLDPEEDGGA